MYKLLVSLALLATVASALPLDASQPKHYIVIACFHSYDEYEQFRNHFEHKSGYISGQTVDSDSDTEVISVIVNVSEVILQDILKYLTDHHIEHYYFEENSPVSNPTNVDEKIPKLEYANQYLLLSFNSKEVFMEFMDRYEYSDNVKIMRIRGGEVVQMVVWVRAVGVYSLEEYLNKHHIKYVEHNSPDFPLKTEKLYEVEMSFSSIEKFGEMHSKFSGKTHYSLKKIRIDFSKNYVYAKVVVNQEVWNTLEPYLKSNKVEYSVVEVNGSIYGMMDSVEYEKYRIDFPNGGAFQKFMHKYGTDPSVQDIEIYIGDKKFIIKAKIRNTAVKEVLAYLDTIGAKYSKL